MMDSDNLLSDQRELRRDCVNMRSNKPFTALTCKYAIREDPCEPVYICSLHRDFHDRNIVLFVSVALKIMYH